MASSSQFHTKISMPPAGSPASGPAPGFEELYRRWVHTEPEPHPSFRVIPRFHHGGQRPRMAMQEKLREVGDGAGGGSGGSGGG